MHDVKMPPKKRSRSSTPASITMPNPDTVSPLGPLYRIGGQAVVLVAAGASFERVTLEVEDNRYAVGIGCVAFTGTPNAGWMYALLAGPVAERMHTGMWNLDPDDDGVTRFARAMARVPIGEPAKATGRAWEALCAVEETAETLWNRWSYVERVVAELRAKRVLSQGDVDAIIHAPETGARRPFVPKADEVLAELEIVLQQNHGLDLGDWRACPRSAPMPAATLERRTNGGKKGLRR
jgi:hypothetical protein